MSQNPTDLPHLTWMPVAEDVAVGYERDVLGDWALAGIVVYGPSTEKIRGLKLRELDRLVQREDPSQVRLLLDAPPTADQVAAAWAKQRLHGVTSPSSAIGVGGGGNLRVQEEVARATAPGQLARRKGEDPDEFYRRVGRAHRALSRATKRPTLELARRCAVPQGTAAAWVNRARARGVYGRDEELT